MMIDERLVSYESKHVRLKVLSPQVVAESDWVGRFNDESMIAFNQHHYFPNTFEQQRDVLAACVLSQKLPLGIVDRAYSGQVCDVTSKRAFG